MQPVDEVEAYCVPCGDDEDSEYHQPALHRSRAALRLKAAAWAVTLANRLAASTTAIDDDNVPWSEYVQEPST